MSDLAYIWIISNLSAKNYQNWCKFDEVLTKTNLLIFLGHGVLEEIRYAGFIPFLQRVTAQC